MRLTLTVLSFSAFVRLCSGFCALSGSSTDFHSYCSRGVDGGILTGKQFSSNRLCSCSPLFVGFRSVVSGQMMLRCESARFLRPSMKNTRSSVLMKASGGGGGRQDGGDAQQQTISREAKLLISVLIDLVGVSSYVLPGLGEVTDLGWAPISSALIFYLYGNAVFAGLAFVEEIIPGLDFVPTATIAWFLTSSELGQNVSTAAGKKTGESGKTSSSASSTTKVPKTPPFGDSEDSVTFGRGSSPAVNLGAADAEVIDVDPVE